MRCDRCSYGERPGFIRRHYTTEWGKGYEMVPCPDCIGGVSSCCEVYDAPADPEDGGGTK